MYLEIIPFISDHT